MPEQTLTMEEAMALMDKHAAEDAAKVKTKTKKAKKVKDLLVEGSKQGRGGLGVNTRKLLDQIDD
jgi:hypothetical protein